MPKESIWRNAMFAAKMSCSFCNKDRSQVRSIIQGGVNGNKVFICDKCVFVCTTQIADEAQVLNMTPAERIRWEERVEALQELYARS